MKFQNSKIAAQALKRITFVGVISFRGFEDCENYFQQELKELIAELLGKFVNGEITDEDPGLVALLNNKDTLMTTLNASQDNHVSWILNCRTDIH
eukprot:TRINITY_DN3824_c0_g1_i1.p2 TRINITY_DN3824_c0_g1~~TRINITY_DN3824_c0_g1_i1.p2  ORF type:complete len:95 (+),score=23.44 TRINITY_DN3824_c0_g1_i1:397-681(+)